MIFNVGGYFGILHYRDGILLNEYRIKNGITNEGLNDLLSSAFIGTTQHTWYFGLIDGATSPTLDPGDTMASHPGWSENTDFNESPRRTWSPVSSGVGKIVNTSYPEHTMNASATIAGAFITSDSTKGGTAGVLWSTALFSNGSVELESGDVLKTYYELTAVGS
jgi:hypothetical protein